jgi:hypothetical protein
MPNIIATPSIVVNNQVINIVPNSCSFTEGYGEQSMRVQSAGGGVVSQVYSNNVEARLSSLKFKLYATADNIALALSWKQNLNNNAISLTGQTSTNTYISRVFNNAAILNDYEVNAQTDGNLDIEFKSDQAI